MDKGNIIDIIQEYSLGERQIRKKHSHTNPYIISPTGKSFAEYLEKNKFFSIFKSIPLKLRSDFQEYYYLKLQNYESMNEWFYDYENHEIFHLFNLPPMGKEYTQDKTIFQIKRFKCADFVKNLFNFELSFICKKCKKENIFIQQIYFSESCYEPLNFDYLCEKCNLNFHSDSTFKRFYMYE